MSITINTHIVSDHHVAISRYSKESRLAGISTVIIRETTSVFSDVIAEYETKAAGALASARKKIADLR